MDAEEECVTTGTAFLPYIKQATDTVNKLLLERHRVRIVFRLTQKIHQYLKLAKDAMDPLFRRQKVLCLCGQVYTGTTKYNVKVHIKEHELYCHLKNQL